MSIVQMDSDLWHAWARMTGIQLIVKTHNRRPAILLQDCWSLYLAIEPPHVTRLQVRVEPDQRGLRMDRIWRPGKKLIPALMVGARGLACTYIRGKSRRGVKRCRLQ